MGCWDAGSVTNANASHVGNAKDTRFGATAGCAIGAVPTTSIMHAIVTGPIATATIANEAAMILSKQTLELCGIDANTWVYGVSAAWSGISLNSCPQNSYAWLKVAIVGATELVN